MSKRRALLLVGLLATLGVSTARAEDATIEEPGTDRLGFYVTAQGLYAFNNFQNLGGLQGDNGLGFKGRIGYRFLPMVAAEGEIEWVNLGLNIPAGVAGAPGGGINVASVTYHTFTANVKVYPPPDLQILEGKLEPYLLGGLGFANVNISGQGIDGESFTRFAGRGGAGIEYHVTDHFSVVGDAEYVASTNELKNLGYLSVGWGFSYNF